MKTFNPRQQGGWVTLALGAATSLMSIGSGILGQGKAKDAEKAQKNAIKGSWIERFNQMAQEAHSVLAAQKAGYAASGVDITVGTPTTLAASTRNEYHRSLMAGVYAETQQLKGAKAEAGQVRTAQMGGYFSTIANFANSVISYQQSKPVTKKFTAATPGAAAKPGG